MREQDTPSLPTYPSVSSKNVEKSLKRVLTVPETDGIINKSLTQATTEP